MASSSDINPKLQVQEVNLTDDDFRIITPFSMIISGPSQSGKSELILKLVKYREKIFSTKFNRIIYCFPSSLATNSLRYLQNMRNEFSALEIFYGLPDLVKLNLQQNRLPCLLIIDDLMTEFLNSEEMTHLITKKVHHLNVSVCTTLQNYFAPSKYGKTIIRNSQLKFIISNPAEKVELSKISQQLSSDANFLNDCFQTLEKYYPTVYSHYILHDGHFQSKLKSSRFRSNIFPSLQGEIKPILFFPADK